MKDNLQFNENEIISIMPMALIITDYEGRILYSNNMANELYGYEVEQIRNMRIQDFELNKDETQIMEKIMEYTCKTYYKKRTIRKHKTSNKNIMEVDISVGTYYVKDEKFLIFCIVEVTKQQELFKSYERAVEIMFKVVNDLSIN